METITGRVSRLQSGFYTVVTEQGVVTCVLRGRLKKRAKGNTAQGLMIGDIVAVGDLVNISVQSGNSGAIESVQPRSSALVRLAPTPRGTYRQVLLANPNQVALVFACAQPEPHLRMLDRLLVICERQGIPALIVANKVDLIGLEAAHEIFGMYAAIGYPVVYTSAKSQLGVDVLKEMWQGKLTGLAGPSGVGKSSLLNQVQPGLGLLVREVSDTTSKGRHTTVVRELFPLEDGGFVADLPGMRQVAIWDIEPEELDGYFPEIRPLVEDCQFNDCTHLDEPGCAVRAAAEQGKIFPVRYQSYLRLRFGGEEMDAANEKTTDTEELL